MPNIAMFRISRRHNKKSLVIIILLLVISIITLWFFNRVCILTINSVKLEGSKYIKEVDSSILKDFIAYGFPALRSKEETQNDNKDNQNKAENSINVFSNNYLDYKNVLNTQYPMLQIQNLKYPVVKQNINNKEKIQKAHQGTTAVTSVKDEGEVETEVQTAEKIYKPTTVIKSSGIEIRNHTSYKVDIDKIKKETLKPIEDRKKTQVIILHTHTSEAYSQSSKSKYQPSDPYRTEDPKYNVVRVGKELAANLVKFSIKSFHDTTIHDYPTYTGSYSRSLQTAIKDMKSYPAAKIVLDIHRDAVSGDKLRPVVSIGKVEAAKIMFVVGTDQMGLKHPKWRENLKFAIKLQQKANELYPGLCRQIDLRQERFNNHVAPGAIIVEVGGTGNTLEEATVSMKFLAKVIAEVTK